MAEVLEIKKEVKLSPAASSESLKVEIVDEKPGTTAEDEEMMQWALGTLQRTQYLSDSESEDEERQNKAFDLVRSRRVRRKPKKKKKVSWKNVGAIISQLTCDEPSQEKLPSQPPRYEKTSEKTIEKRTLPRHDTVFLSCPAEPDELLEEGELKVEPSEDPLSLSAQPENTDVGCSSRRPCVVLDSPDAQASQQPGSALGGAEEQIYTALNALEDIIKWCLNTKNDNAQVDAGEGDTGTFWTSASSEVSNALNTSESSHPLNQLRSVQVLSPVRWNSIAAQSALDGLYVSGSSDTLDAPSPSCALHALDAIRPPCSSSALSSSEASHVSSASTVMSSRVWGTLETIGALASKSLDISGTFDTADGLDSSQISSASRLLDFSQTLSALEHKSVSAVDASGTSQRLSVTASEGASHSSRARDAWSMSWSSSTSQAPAALEINGTALLSEAKFLREEGICRKCYEHLEFLVKSLSDAYSVARSPEIKGQVSGDLCCLCDKPPFGLGYTIVRHIVAWWLYQCEGCKRRYAEEKLLREHGKMCVVPQTHPPRCVLCVLGPGCKNSAGFPFNISVKCPACELSFSVICELRLQSQLCIHRGIHLSVQRFICCICRALFDNKLSLNVHQLTTHGVTRKISGASNVSRMNSASPPLSLCKEGICWTCYDHLVTIVKHLSDVYPFVRGQVSGDLCSVCDKPPFGVGYTIVRHIVAWWLYQCKRCKRRYAEETIFWNHQKTCVGLQKCVLCVAGPGCSNSLGLPFSVSVKCSACQQSFSVIFKLRLQSQQCEHNSIHFCAQRFICGICGLWMEDKISFNVHQRMTHGVTRRVLPRAYRKRARVCGESWPQSSPVAHQ